MNPFDFADAAPLPPSRHYYHTHREKAGVVGCCTALAQLALALVLLLVAVYMVIFLVGSFYLAEARMKAVKERQQATPTSPAVWRR